jgi:hypothetical protein
VVSGYWQNCPYPPVNPAYPEQARCAWRRLVSTDRFGPGAERAAQRELARHMKEAHMHKAPMLSLVDTSNKLTLTADQLEVLIAGIQAQLGELSVTAVLADETLIPLLVDLRRMAKEGGTINVIPF